MSIVPFNANKLDRLPAFMVRTELKQVALPLLVTLKRTPLTVKGGIGSV